jgi:dihydrofolate synthase/folylpolyglutamate synthase
LCRIAFEKAGIARPGSPLVTQAYREDVELEIERRAGIAGAPLHMRGRDWWAWVGHGENVAIDYRDRFGELTLPLPALPGRHQGDNAALAVAMLRHQDYVTVSAEAMAKGLQAARWPARLQLLRAGPLTALAEGHEVWLDGGHNADAGLAIGRHFADSRLHLVVGMLANRHPEAIIAPLEDRLLSVTAVPIEGSESHDATAYGASARWADSIELALRGLPADGAPVLIAGSLYLAGKVLKANGEVPD